MISLPRSKRLAQRVNTVPLERHWAVIGLLSIGLMASIGLSLGLGSFPTPPGQVVHALVAPLESDIAFIIWELRLPRILLAVLVGAALAFAGAILQGIVRNPLASPDVIGITSGAAMASVIFLALLSTHLSIGWLPSPPSAARFCSLAGVLVRLERQR